MFAIDIILGLSTALVAIYCIIISKKMNEFFRLENGMGNAIAVFSVQVDELKAALEKANTAAKESSYNLQDLVERAQSTEKKLELMMASLQDMPAPLEDPIHLVEARQFRSRLRKQPLRAAE